MEVDILKICGVAVLCSVVGAVIGKLVGGVAVAVKLCGLALVLSGAIALIGQVTEQVALMGEGSASEYVSLMVKGLGIVTLGRVCADVCRDCGETGVAAAVETCSKLAVLVLAMPSVFSILEAVDELISRV